MNFKLITFSTNKITIGKLYLDDELLCNTVERPWLDNKRNLSCIPPGEYKLKPVVSPKFGETFEVCDVENRSHILIHKGNFVHDSLGCIMPCSDIGVLGVEIAGISSGTAYDQLMIMLGDKEHTLTIERY